MENQILNKLLEKVDSIDQKVDFLDQKVDSIDQKVGFLDQKVDSIDQKVDSIESRVDILEEELKTIKKSTLIMEEEHGKKLDVLLEVYPPLYSSYVSTDLRLAKTESIVGLHSMQLKLIEEKLKPSS